MAGQVEPRVIADLHIRGLGVIEDAVLELSPGLTVVTGETGAGKTMVVTGLGLLFGGRADAGAVRKASARAMVEAAVDLPPGSAARTRAVDLDAEVEDGLLLMARAVSVEGRSRAWVGGRSVPVGVLAELADDLVAVHGQSDQRRLLHPARQRQALDRYAGAPVAEPLAKYRQAYTRLRAVETDRAQLATTTAERALEADRLRFGLDEISAVAPQPGEDARLDAEAERLANADELRGAADLAHAALVGDPAETRAPAMDALAAVSTARRALDQARRHDQSLGELADRMLEVAALTADIGADIASYAAGVEADPVRLAAVEDRRAALKGLTRKYGASCEEVLAWAARAGNELENLDGDDGRIATLDAERAELRATLATLAGQISTARRDAGTRFAAAVTAELADLAMPDATMGVAVTTTEKAAGAMSGAATTAPRSAPAGAAPDLAGDALGVLGVLEIEGRTVAFGPHGVDDVEIVLTPHPGAPARALARGASGGELSRVMLAVEVVFADADPVPTFVFDEVDAGVGGRAAVEVGRRLARLARTAQVLVVTHLPQVAAFADQHLVVEKSSNGAVTRSGVHTLDGPGRVAELTRMLAGLDESQSGRAHAQELLAAATSSKAT